MLASAPVLAPRRLYFNWERSHWSAGALDFSQDRRDWEAVGPDERTMLVDSLAPFFAGEARVANTFGPILMSAADDQERAFLATQQADEARHMQFFSRFWREVFLPDERDHRAALHHAEERCNAAFSELFDRRLNGAVERLWKDPSSVEAKIEAITVYHLIVEGVLGLTAMHFVLDYLRKNAIMPGIVEGMTNTKRDEHRHVAYGTWYLRERCREEARYGVLIQNSIGELLPYAAGVVTDGDVGFLGGEGGCGCSSVRPSVFLDYPSNVVNAYALTAVSRRLQVIGGSTHELQQLLGLAAMCLNGSAERMHSAEPADVEPRSLPQ